MVITLLDLVILSQASEKIDFNSFRRRCNDFKVVGGFKSNLLKIKSSP